jgi:Ca2+-binding RTX toxin-like protein
MTGETTENYSETNEGNRTMPLTTTVTLEGFPDAQSTGVRAGVTLRQVGDMTVTTPGAVISGLEIHGTLRIEADNVTIRDCKIVDEGGWHGILIPDGNTGAVVEFCDIIGPVNGISGTGTFRSNDFSSTDNGINVYGPSLIVDNYIHDMDGGSDAHYDGIEINGGGGTTIRHNTIINDHSQTSAVMINNDFGAVPGIIIDNNYLAGGGYTIYSDGRFSSSDPITGVQITNNYLGQGYWGYYAFFNNTPLVSGNHQLGTTWPTPVSDGSTPIPATGSLSINDVTISEGNSGTKAATFTVTRSGGTAAFDVNFDTSDATATVADSDYVAASNMLHFGANENTKTISVTINGDTTVESNQTFNVRLLNATNGATISDSQGVGTITNDDGEVIASSVSINDVTISEGNSGTKAATFTVTRSGGTAAFDVNFATSDATATVVDSDYVAASDTLHFGANENTKTLSVTINGDSTIESNQTFNVRLSNATNGATISDSRGVGTITNDDGATPTTTTGTGGNDVLKGTSGADVLMGYAGNDTYTVNSTADEVVELANAGIDKVESTISYTLAGNVENLQLMDDAQINGAGNGLGNTIIGNDVSNRIEGNAGNDTLNGWGGKDTLLGGSGNDVFQFSSQFSADGDKVMDFVQGVDKFDFSKIDASAYRSGDQAFTFDGYDDGGRNRHLWAVEDQAADVTHVYGKTGDFQFHIDLQGVHLGLTSSDFIL